jgi:predicted nuclease with TOPRIM domain
MTEAPETIRASLTAVRDGWYQLVNLRGGQRAFPLTEYTRSDIADGLRDSIVSRNDLLAELARNVEGRQERIDTLEAEVARLKAALRTMVYEATHLSQEEEDLSHWCKLTGDALQAARAALAHGEAK